MNPTQKVGAGGCGDTVTSDDGGEVTRVYIIHRHQRAGTQKSPESRKKPSGRSEDNRSKI